MTWGKKTGGKNFEPGNNFGKGRPPVPDDLKRARNLNKIELERLINKYMRMTVNDIKKALKNDNLSGIDRLVCSILAGAIAKGDHTRAGFILDRSVGPVKKELELSGITIADLAKRFANVDLPMPGAQKQIEPPFEVSSNGSSDKKGDSE